MGKNSKKNSNRSGFLVVHHLVVDHLVVDRLGRSAWRTQLAALWIVLAAAAWDAGTAAHARSQMAPWCAWNPGIGNYDCSYYTHNQCMATAWGLGGLCVPNPRVGYAEPVRYRRRPR
jgi:hypothetical protein